MRAIAPLYRSYIIGFVICLCLTIASFLYVTLREGKGLDGEGVIVLVVSAVLQIIVQTTLFLHLGREPSPRWNTLSFATMIMVVVFIVAGSLWVMNNLNYNMMPEHNPGIDEAIRQDEGF